MTTIPKDFFNKNIKNTRISSEFEFKLKLVNATSSKNTTSTHNEEYEWLILKNLQSCFKNIEEYFQKQ